MGTAQHYSSYVQICLVYRVGLDVLMKDDHVMKCHTDAWAAKYHSELGAAAAIFKAGYNLGSLLIRYVCCLQGNFSAYMYCSTAVEVSCICCLRFAICFRSLLEADMYLVSLAQYAHCRLLPAVLYRLQIPRR